MAPQPKVEAEDAEMVDVPKSASKRRATKATVVESEAESAAEEKKPVKRRKVSKKADEDGNDESKPKKKAAAAKKEAEVDEDGNPVVKPKKAAKPKTMKLAQVPTRQLKSRKWVGAHVSTAGGLENAVANGLQIGARALALFIKNQRSWTSPPLSDRSVELFDKRCAGELDDLIQLDEPLTESGQLYDPATMILPHGSYLVNLANPDEEKWAKAHTSFVDELQRCERAGIRLFNFHPGSSTGACTHEEALASVAKGINEAHKQTKKIILVVENMAHATGKAAVGGSWEDLAGIIALVEDKARVGVCIDTCHAHAAGYDLSPDGYEATIAEFDKTVGLKYLKAWHINDSKTERGSHRDLHENLGIGHLGLGAFACLMQDKRMDQMPMVLETPMLEKTLVLNESNGGMWAREIQLLYRLEQVGPSGVETDAEVLRLAKEIREAVDAENVRNPPKPKGKRAAGKKGKKDVDDGEEEDEE